MVIQQKKNSVRVAKKRIPYKKRLFKRLRLNQFRRSWKYGRRELQVAKRRQLLAKMRLTRRQKKLMILRIYKLAVPGYATASYINRRVDALRVKRRLFRYSRRMKKRFWRRKYRRGFKQFYLKFLHRKPKFSRVGYYKIINKFYRRKSFTRFLHDFIKYARLKAILRKYKKVFKRKPKKVVRKEGLSRVEKLLFLNVFFQSIVFAGKKKLSSRIFVDLFTLLKFKWKGEFIIKYLYSLERIRPLINYKVMFISGKKYKIPVLMPISKSYAVAVRWLINNSIENGNAVLSMFGNVNSAVRNEGSLIKHRKEYHSISFENKTYIRFLRFLKTGF